MRDYRFTSTWFQDVAEKNWGELFKVYPQKPKRVLEIGCFEGRATVWMCDNVLEEGAEYDIIDTFGGSLDESGMNLDNDISFIETNFRHNISFHPNIKFNIHKGYSQKILPTFPQLEVYDFIYIDASHRADDTFVDAYYAHKMLKSGGILIFDDYGWKDPKDLHLINSPQLGVEVFNTMYDNYYTLIFQGYQVGFIKK
jgi:SAM-dependent methyltransferase